MEIEIKSLLTKEKYKELKEILPQKFKKIDEDFITTFRFKPKDIRIRFSDKISEIVFKDKDPTAVSRKEISINLKDKDECLKMIDLLRELGFKDDPSWTNEKEEFICFYDGFEYILSLQFIEDFAYLLEAEIVSDDPKKHIPNLKKIISDLGCEPIDPEDFKERINNYVKEFSKN